MKNKAIQTSILIIVVFITISCRKKNDNPDNPAEIKKYVWAVGAKDSTGYGTILFSSNYGDSWERQGLGTLALQGVDITDIWAIDENNIWAIGSNNVILKTSNSGRLWEKVQVPAVSPNSYLMSISIINKTNIWISGSNGVVYNSSDNGSNWSLFDTAFFKNGQMQGIWAVSPEKVFVVGGNNAHKERGVIGYTFDGGATWDSIVPADDYNRYRWIGVCSSGNTIVIYGSKAHYMVSTDGGTTWKNDSLQTGGTDGADLNHLIMLDYQKWWGAFDDGQIFITTNGGTSWDEQQTGQGGFYLLGFGARNSQLALAVGATLSHPVSSTIIKTTNGGTTWEKKYGSTLRLYQLTFIKD